MHDMKIILIAFRKKQILWSSMTYNNLLLRFFLNCFTLIGAYSLSAVTSVLASKVIWMCYCPRTFNRSGANPAVALDISKAFDKIWHAGLPLKVKFYGISGHIFGLISFFLCNRQLQVIQDGKSSQQYPVDAGVPQEFILGPALFLLYINDLPDDVICNIAIYADSATLYCKCNQAPDLWQQL